MPAPAGRLLAVFLAFAPKNAGPSVNGLPRWVVRSHSRPRPVAHTIPRMNGLMMDYPLTLSTIFRRGETI